MCYSALVGACRKVGSYVGQNNFEFYIPWQIITQRIVLDWCGVYVGNVLHAEIYRATLLIYNIWWHSMTVLGIFSVLGRRNGSSK